MNMTHKIVTAAALFSTISGLASASVLLTASASPNPLKLGGVSTVSITLSDSAATTNSVGGFQFDIDFNPAVLQANAITEEGYFANNGVIGLTTATINNTAGTITLISDAAATPEDPGAGDPLVGITFSAIGLGSSPITVANDIISNPQSNSITASVMNTTVNVLTAATPEPASIFLSAIGFLVALFGIRKVRAC